MKNKNTKKEETKDQDIEKPTNDLVFCYEAIVTLNTIMNNLDYIGKYTSSNSEGIMSKAIGSQIEQSMKKHLELEKQFEKLISDKNQKTELVDEIEINQYKLEIAKTAQKLKESTNNICKSLAENPDIPKNLRKAQIDILKIIVKLNMIKQDLIEGSFEKFVKMSEDLRENSINIQDLRNKEMKLFEELRKLNKQLLEEEAEYVKESKSLNFALSLQKKQLAQTKMEEEILREYRTSDLYALKELKEYDIDQETLYLKNLIEEKEREKIMEDEIFNHVASYLREAKDKVKSEKEQKDKENNNKKNNLADKKAKLDEREKKKLNLIEELKNEIADYESKIAVLHVKQFEKRV